MDYMLAMIFCLRPNCLSVSGNALSASAVEECVELLAAGLASEIEWHPNKGQALDKIACILSVNSAWKFISSSIWAIHRVGGIATPANSHFSPSELATQLRDCSAHVSFTCLSLAETALEVAGKAGIPSSRVYLLDLPKTLPNRKAGGNIKSKERNAIVARYAGVEIRGAEDVKADLHYGPFNPIPAVEGLRVQGGFACRCGLLTTSWKWLRVHFNKEHPTWNVNSRERQWSLVRVQTFFTRPKRAIRYFCVTTTGDDTNTAAATLGTEAAPGTGGQGGLPSGVEDDELVAGIKERWACGQDQQEEIQKVLADGAAKHEITNWLRRSGWTAHFVGRDLGEIHASSRMPGPGEEEARRLIAATDQLFFNRCVAGLRSMPLMTRLLLASPHSKDAHSRPFGPLQEKTSMNSTSSPCSGSTASRDSYAQRTSSRRFAAVRDEWLCKATYSPMGYTLSLLLYGKKIARETSSQLMVSWNRQCDLMYFMGKPIAMDAIQSMVAEMITDAEDILWGELMFKEGHDVRFTILLDTIEDDLTYTHRGKSFIYTNDLEGKEVEMLEDLVRSRRKGEFLDPGGEWRWEGIRKYQKSVRKFEELLVLAV
ncbi:hypothetical protein CC79DRAFT_1321165 [Sarocladium strictum]